jgi:hypothetical protein
MGQGDELMAAGHAEYQYRLHPGHGPVAICDLHGTAKWHQLWEGNPVIARPIGTFANKRQPGTPFIRNSKGCRPYIQYPFTGLTGWKWATDWTAREHGRGTLYLTPQEIDKGMEFQRRYGDFVLVEPSPIRGNKNRRYPHESWVAIVGALQAAGLTVLQPEHDAARDVPTTIKAPHSGFREACGILAASKLFLATEGGLVHAAAALKIPTVALWGGCVSEPVLGYPEHRNLVDTDPKSPCGTWAPCEHCKEAWHRLTPACVVKATLEEWDRVSA